MTKLLLVFLLSFSSIVGAIELKIESDPVFKAILNEFAQPSDNLALYMESENYRLDLSLYDLIDKVTIITENKRFTKYKEELHKIAQKDLIYFYDWYQKLKSFALTDARFLNILNRKLFLQIYSRNGIALLPDYKIIDFKKLKDIGLKRRITRYNSFLNSPEGNGLVAAFEKTSNEPFVTTKLTVAKMKLVRNKTMKKIVKSYYKGYLKLHRQQFYKENKGDIKYQKVSFIKSMKNSIKASPIEEDDTDINGEQVISQGKGLGPALKVFNVIHGLPHKNEVLAFLAQDLSRRKIVLPKISGLFIMTPIFIKKNWKVVDLLLKEYTITQFANLNEDEYTLIVRKWVKNNYNKIKERLSEYNLANERKLDFTVARPNRLPLRVDVLEQYDVLLELFSDKPWLSNSDQPDFIDKNGRPVFFRGQTIGQRLNRAFKKIIKVENYLSILAGSTVLIVSGGNASLALSVRSLVKSAVYTKKHDKEWSDFLRNAPAEVLNAILLGSGFSAGRLYKIIALGSAQGALQSYITGQDVRTGAIVGAGMNLLNYYVLPYALSKPMTSGFDANSLRTNRYLEIIEKTIKRSVQGGIVAAATGESIFKGAAKGAAYGVVSTSLTIWLLGTRYNAFKDYDPEEVDNYLDAETNFQNDVGRGGEYKITRQLIEDANVRVGGAWPKMISASQVLPGNVVMTDQGFNRLSTLTHEASHLMQHHQSGVFGFYLVRYIPTYFRTGYEGHPDENFLRDFLGEYLIP